jgi:hypothetical protein
VFDLRRLSGGSFLKSNARIVLQIEPEPLRVVFSRSIDIFSVDEVVIRQRGIDVANVQDDVFETKRCDKSVRLDRKI